MSHPISALGAGHTAISLVPLLAGLYSFARYRHIDASRLPGKIYVAGLLLSVLTSFGLSSSGGLNAGHVVGILTLMAVYGALAVSRLPLPLSIQPYLSRFGFSFSFFLLMVPGLSETLMRLPASHPIADGPQAPVLRVVLAAWLLIFLAGFAWQCWQIRSQGRNGRVT